VNVKFLFKILCQVLYENIFQVRFLPIVIDDCPGNMEQEIYKTFFRLKAECIAFQCRL